MMISEGTLFSRAQSDLIELSRLCPYRYESLCDHIAGVILFVETDALNPKGSGEIAQRVVIYSVLHNIFDQATQGLCHRHNSSSTKYKEET